jgi:FKBP-type peptidyl-prolyl cis-trans isomerase FklB
MRLLTILFIAFLSLPLRAEPMKLDTDRGRISYSLGHQIGSNLKRQGVDVDPEALKRGMEDALSGAAPQMGEEEMDKARAELRERLLAARQAQAEKEAQARIAAGRDFLEANKAKPGVVVLPSGLQYRVIKAGTGKKPGPGDQVTVNYRGTLVDGTEFDSSYRRNRPATFPVSGVIPGWTEGLQQMQEGGRYELVIPPELAYGDRGRLADETLVFEVELLSVEPGAPAKAAE